MEQVYNMFHRQYMHAMLMESAINEKEKEGDPAVLAVNHKVCIDISLKLTSMINAL